MIYGELPTKPVVYAACDTKYFVEHAPSLIYSINDISEEIARVIGYNNIEIQDFKIPINYKAKKTFVESFIKMDA